MAKSGFKVPRLPCAFSALASLFLSSLASAQGLAILYHEPAGNFQIRETPTLEDSPSQAALDESPLQPAELSFTAFGREFDFSLRENDRLLRGVLARRKGNLERPRAYRGTLVGSAGSWARFVIEDGIATGAFWDGTDLYVVEEARNVAAYVAIDDELPPSQPIVYRRSETVLDISDVVVAPALPESPTLLESAGPISRNQEVALSPSRQLEIAVIADQELAQREGTETEARVLSILNIVDGIYAWQLGIHLSIGELVIFDSGTDPFDSSVPEDLLLELGEEKERVPQLRALGLAHLFTGKNLSEPAGHDGEILGIANIGGLCSARVGVGLTQSTHDVFTDALIAAHEIGHNFGAPHDNEVGSTCASTPPDFLMDAKLSGSDTFSECSITQMLPRIAAADCLGDLAPSDSRLKLIQSPDAVQMGEAFEVVVAVENVGTDSAIQVELTVGTSSLELLSVSQLDADLWTCDDAGRPARCWTLLLAPGASSTFSLSLVKLDAADGLLLLDVATQNDSDPSNDHVARIFEVLPFVDLVSSIEGGDMLLHPNEETTVRFSTHNDGLEIAAAVEMEIDLAPRLDVLAIVPGTGSCSMIVRPGRQLCTVGDVAPGGSAHVDVRVRAKDRPSIDVIWDRSLVALESTSNRADFDESDNSQAVYAIVSDRFVDIEAALAGPTVIDAGSAFRFDLQLVNRGPEEATTVRVDLRPRFGEFGMVELEVTDSANACVYEDIGAVERIFCELARMAPGGSLDASIAGVVGTEGEGFGSNAHVWVDVWQREWDLDAATNTITYDVEIRSLGSPGEPPAGSEPPGNFEPTKNLASTPTGSVAADGSDAAAAPGGGGTVGLCWLALLIAVTLSRSLSASMLRQEP